MRKQSAAAFDDLRAQSAVFKPGARSRDRRLTLLRIGQLAKLTEKLDQVTEASKALVDEIAGLEGLPGQIEIAELTVVRNKFRKTQSHFEEASKEFEKLQSRKLVTLEAETWRLRKAAAEDRSKLEAERALANEDKNKLEAEKRVLQAEVQVAEHSRQMLEDESSCQICLNSAKNVVLLPCFHAQFCSQGIDTHRKTNTTCPTCRSVIQGTMPCIA